MRREAAVSARMDRPPPISYPDAVGPGDTRVTHEDKRHDTVQTGERTSCMSDLPAVLVGVIPLVLVAGLVYIILRTLPPHDRQQGRNTPSDGHTPRFRHIVPLETRPRWRRLVPTLRFTSRDGKKPPPRERSRQR